MRIIAGRNVAQSDSELKPHPVVLTESSASEFFPHVDPSGREFGTAGPDGFAEPTYRIDGVVQNVKYRGMREDAPPTFFGMFPSDEVLVTLHVRARIADSAMMRQIHVLLASTGSGLAPVSTAIMEQEIETSPWQERMLSFLSQVFGGLAVIIGSIGCFALISYTLARRTHEVSIRVALGATPRRIATMFAGFVCAAVLPGAVLGAIGFISYTELPAVRLG